MKTILLINERKGLLLLFLLFLLMGNGCEKDSPTDPNSNQPKAEIRNIHWNISTFDDYNNNGYTSYRELHIEYRHTEYQAWLFIRVKYKKSSSSTYITYWRVNLEAVDWDSIDLDIGLQIELSKGVYDFEVSVYDDLDNFVSSYGPYNDSQLKAQAFETIEEDIK